MNVRADEKNECKAIVNEQFWTPTKKKCYFSLNSNPQLRHNSYPNITTMQDRGTKTRL